MTPEIETLLARCPSLDRLVIRLLAEAADENLFDDLIANDP